VISPNNAIVCLHAMIFAANMLYLITSVLMNIEKTLLHILNKVTDPSLGKTADEMGVKALFDIEADTLHLNLSAGIPCDFLKETYLPVLQLALEQALPNYKIIVSLDQFIKVHQTQMPGKGLRGIKNIIAVASGKGGVGKSTVTVNLAISLAKAGCKVGVLDADIYGPSIPLMLGKWEPIQIQDDFYLPVHSHGLAAMSIGYLTKEDAAVIWRGPMLAKSLIQMINSTNWGELDYLLIDLPPGTGDIQLTLVQKIPLSGAIIVTTPQNVATLDAQKAIQMFEKTNITVLGLIENMATYHCPRCGHEENIFSKGGGEMVAKKHQTPLLGYLPLNAQIQQDCDAGIPTAVRENDAIAQAFRKAALNMSIELARQPLNYADKFPPIIVE
jgi:ATP-binding protein involved in chromosome partitioning